MSEIQETINEFRNRHLSELTEVCNCDIIQWPLKRILRNEKIKNILASEIWQTEFLNGSESRIACVDMC